LVYLVCVSINELANPIFENASLDDTTANKLDNKYKQIKYVINALFLTSMLDETIKYLICYRGLKQYFSLSPPLSQINNIILYCTAVGIGIGIGKGALAIILLGSLKSNGVTTVDHGLIFDYKYGILDYVIMPFMQKDLHSWPCVLIYSFIMVPFQAALGALWGVCFVRRYVLEHYIAFGQMLMFPWLFHATSNILLSQLYYNIDRNYTNYSLWLSLTICVPISMLFACIFASILIYKRRVEPSTHANRKF